MVFVQAGTGWKGPKEESVLEVEREALVQNRSSNTRSARED